MPIVRLLRDIVRANQQALAETGEIDPAAAARLIGEALERDRPQVVLGLGEFVAYALDGSVPDPDSLTV
jgi:hypothetical protein